MDFSGRLREWYERMTLTDAQVAAIRWLASHPDGPARVLVISEEWSSGCRRDVPVLARLAEAGGMDLRIFPRDGAPLGRGPTADPAQSPNADYRHLYHYVESPAIYHKERRPGDSREQTWARFIEDWGALHSSRRSSPSGQARR